MNVIVILGLPLAAALAAFTILWAFSLARRDAGLVDVYWGPGFVVIGWLAFALSGRPLAPDILLLAPLTLWGLRLGWHIARRHRGVEDFRYAAMRAAHGDAFARRSLWMVFWLQAAIQWLASAPALAVATAGRDAGLDGAAGAILVVLGLVLFAAGFLLEWAADRAVARFRADPANAGRLLTTGLHGRVRHPNYLGEIMLQWGLGLVALALSGEPLALTGPLLMHGLILRLSGVPLLEAELAKRSGFEEWRARTGAVWPRFRA